MAIKINSETEWRIVAGVKAADVSVNDYLILTLGLDMTFSGEVSATWRVEHEERRAAHRLASRKRDDA